MSTGARIFKNIKEALKSPAFVLLLVLVAASAAFHVPRRAEHFEECDSSAVFQILRDVPRQAVAFTESLAPGSGFISASQARALLEYPAVAELVEKVKGDWREEEMVTRITNLNPLSALRLVMITGFSELPLSDGVRGFFTMPWGSTYYPGMGLLYELVGGTETPYEVFQARITFLTLFLFHLSAILVFFLARKIGAGEGTALLASALFLVSISMYSYGYHMGTTVWNYTTGFLWLLLLAAWAEHPKMLRRMSTATAALVFFNYLIVIFWAGLIWYACATAHAPKRKKIWNIIKSQRAALAVMLFVFILFFPLGEGGNRASATWRTLPSDVYYTLLNFFSVYNKSAATNIVQFTLFACVIALGIYIAARRRRNNEDSARFLIRRVVLYTLTATVLAVLLRQLSFAPSRHILFLVPAAWVFVVLAAEQLSSRISPSGAAAYMASGMLVGLALFTLPLRARDTYDATRTITPNPAAEEILVFDCSHNLVAGRRFGTATAVFADPRKLREGVTYELVSQTHSREEAFASWRAELGLEVTAKMISEENKESDVYFLAHNPDQDRLPFNRQNGRFVSTFTVVNVAPISP